MEVINKNYYEFTIKDLKESLADGGEIVIPLYQRGITWKKHQRENLINTLINKYPFGCILLNKYDGNKYRIIDGLQRSYALIDFYDNPIDYYVERYISEEEINKIAKFAKDIKTKEDIKFTVPEKIVTYVTQTKKCQTMKDLKDIDISELVIEIINTWPQLLGKAKEINSIINMINTKFIDNYEKIIKDMRVPAQIFEAPEENLPDIFERINREGSKLTRFQVYAATWSDDKVIIPNPELKKIVDNVRQRYENYVNEVGKLDDFDSKLFVKKKEVNIFDLLYGFGRMISTEYPNLFSSKAEESWGENEIPSIGFNLINACLLQKSNNMDRLNKTIEKLVGFDSANISSFLHNIIECISYVDKKLSRATKFKGNKNPDAIPTPLHSELQIVSIIASLYVAKYIDYETNEEGEVIKIQVNKNCNQKWTRYYKKKFDKNVLLIYSNDLISSKWKGSGDSKLYKSLLNNYYRRDITWEEFKNTIENYYISQKNERNERTKVANPNSADKLIINLLYSSILSAGDQIDGSGFDIEHLATKGIMKERIQEYNEKENLKGEYGLPISSIGNICLLPKEYNELKGEKLMYNFREYMDPKEKRIIKYDIKKYEKKYTFTQEKNFEWLMNQDEKYNSEEFAKKYDEYLELRFKKIKTKLQSMYFRNNKSK